MIASLWVFVGFSFGAAGLEAQAANRPSPVPIPQRESPDLEGLQADLKRAQQAGSPKAETEAHLRLGLFFRSSNSNAQALEHFATARAAAHKARFFNLESAALNNLGEVHVALHELNEAKDSFEKAQVLSRRGRDNDGEAVAVANLGAWFELQGRHDEAISRFEQALSLHRRSRPPQPDREAGVLALLGEAHQGAGRYGRAVGFYQQAQAIAQAEHNGETEARALNQLGTVYDLLGQHDRAITNFSASLSRTTNRRLRATLFNNLGAAHARAGRAERATEFYESALDLWSKLKDAKNEANTRNNLATVNRSLGRYQFALGLHNQVIATARDISDRRLEGNAINNLGATYRSLDRLDDATEQFDRALLIAREGNDPVCEAAALSNLMVVWRDRRPRLAIMFGKLAVNLCQRMRTGIQNLENETQSDFVRSRQNTYRLLADLLIAAGRFPEAQQVLRMLKQDEYSEFVRGGAEPLPPDERVTLGTDEAGWEQRYREIAGRVTAIGSEYRTLYVKRDLTPREEERLSNLASDLDVASKAFDKFVQQVEDELTKSRQPADSLAFAREAQSLMGNLAELGEGVVAIHTVVSEAGYRAFVTTATAQKGAEYMMPEAELNAKIFEFRRLLENPFYDPKPLAQELYRIIFAPISNDLDGANARTLMWSLDGVLRYLPIAALHDGKQYLVERFRISTFVQTRLQWMQHKARTDWRGLGLGVSKPHDPFAALPGVTNELYGIIRPDGTAGEGVMPGEIKLDEEFTESSMKAALRRRYALVHIASHFQIGHTEETSFLLLGVGRMPLAQFKHFPPLFGGVELLTLSACNTATSTRLESGKEIDCLATFAERQGAQAVIATLWPVADRSTALLMQRFYRFRQERPDLPKIEALRQAQLGLLRGEVTATTLFSARRGVKLTDDAPTPRRRFDDDPKRPFAHPYYWAPFILCGNWQ